MRRGDDGYRPCNVLFVRVYRDTRYTFTRATWSLSAPIANDEIVAPIDTATRDDRNFPTEQNLSLPLEESALDRVSRKYQAVTRRSPRSVEKRGRITLTLNDSKHCVLF